MKTKKKTTKKKGSTRKRSEKENPTRERAIKEETMRGIWGVLILMLAVFFMLSAFNFAGRLGSTIFEWLTALFGVGYYLIPLSLGLFSFALFNAYEHKVGKLKTAGSIAFFMSGLAMIETLFTEAGGLIGKLLSTPLLWAVEKAATIIVLLSMLVISLLVMFDTHPHFAFPSIFRRNKKDTDDDGSVLGEHEEAVIEKETKKISASIKDTNETSSKETELSTKSKTPSILSFAKNKGVDDHNDFVIKDTAVGNYVLPPISFLKKDKGKPLVGDVKASANAIKRTLQDFGINVEMDEVSIGPTVTRYALKPAQGVRLTRILSLQSNLELALAASPIRIEAPIPGKALVGVEVPNTSKSVLGLNMLFANAEFQKSNAPLLTTLGRDITGQPHYIDLAKMPHMLIAGATGAGKSVTIHDLLISLLYRSGPEQLRLVLVDPKRVELTLYNGIPHLLTPVITNPKKAILALKWLIKEMEDRYNTLEKYSVRDISSYLKNIYEPAHERGEAGAENDIPPMPYIVCILDELADLMQAYPRELEAAIVRLAQMSRAVGIHLVLATQRPDVRTITGLIKANIPARLALQVASQIDSRTILDMGGAEKLLGKGDMLFLSGEMSKPVRIQAPYVSEEELKKVVKFLVKESANSLPDEIDLDDVGRDASIFSATVGGSFGDHDSEEDSLYEDAKQTVIEAGKASTSYLQRKLRVGYARAARLMDILEERGVVGPADGSKPREIVLDETRDEEE